MHIKTKEFAPSYDELVSLFTKDFFQKKKYLIIYPLIIPFAFYYLALWAAIGITLVIAFTAYKSLTHYKKYFKDPKNSVFFEKRIMEFHDDKVWAKLESGSELNNSWSDFIGYKISDELILIQLTKVQYYIIPPSAFETGDREKLIDFLKTKFN